MDAAKSNLARLADSTASRRGALSTFRGLDRSQVLAMTCADGEQVLWAKSEAA